MTPAVRPAPAWRLLLGIGAATAAAHIGNNFSTYLIGGLIDRYGFSPAAMGAWSMTETLSYAAAMFVIAPRATTVRPRGLAIWAGLLVVLAQAAGALGGGYALLLLTRVGTGIGFGLANAAVNLAAGTTRHPARAISIGITCQTLLYAAVNIVLPLVGRQGGVAGMFLALAALSAVLTVVASALPGRPVAARDAAPLPRTPLGAAERRVLLAMALFTFGSLAIWPFMERAAHAIGISAVAFGRYQSAATLASALGNVVLAAIVGRIRGDVAVALALATCGAACCALTLSSAAWAFAVALVAYNVAWFVSYPLLLGIAYRVDRSGRLPVLCSAVWLTMTSVGSLLTGIVAQVLGSYAPVGPLGLVFCLLAAACAVPVADRAPASNPTLSAARPRTG